MFHFIKYVIQLMLSPSPGWEDISSEGREMNALVYRGLFPFALLVALSTFVGIFDEKTFGDMMHVAIVSFVKYVMTYYLAVFMFSMYVSNLIVGELNEKRNTTFIAYSIGVLMFINLFSNCIPNVPLTELLPLYIIVVMTKGYKYMAIQKEKKVKFVLLSVISIFVPPYLFSSLFNYILPN